MRASDYIAYDYLHGAADINALLSYAAELESALEKIVNLSRSTPRRVGPPHPASVALTKAGEIASAALSG